jgi:hypothetical protein
MAEKPRISPEYLDSGMTLEDAEEVHLALDMAEDAAVWAERLSPAKASRAR